MKFLANNKATVFPHLFYINVLWCHSFGGIIPLQANIIATVYPPKFFISGLWYHSFGGIIPY